MTRPTITDDALRAEFLEHALFMVAELGAEIGMLRDMMAKHGDGCTARYVIELEVGVLEAAQRYYAHCAERFRSDASDGDHQAEIN